eukprot:gene3485-13549_t
MSELAPKVVKKVVQQLIDLQEKPCEGIKVILNEQNVSDVTADMEGPVGTPFESGIFRLRLCLGSDFPNAPPKGIFLTKIFHPNVSTSGEICVNVLKKDWTADMGLRHVLMVIRCLLIQPFPDSALNEEAGRLLFEDYEEYAKHAALMTSIHAKRHTPTPLTTSGANASGGGASCVDGKKDTGESSPSQLLKKNRLDQKAMAGGGISKLLGTRMPQYLCSGTHALPEACQPRNQHAPHMPNIVARYPGASMPQYQRSGTHALPEARQPRN